ncbi:MAG: GNAT family protein [Firmicutes bacterium]|nr:GNAT family protein [Bacillota bacterium]
MFYNKEEFTLPSGEKIVLGSATEDDAEAIMRHLELTSKETYFMMRYPEELSKDAEKARKIIAETINSPVNFSVTAFSDGKIVGDLGVSQVRNHIKVRHRASVGISIIKSFWGRGLGTLMLTVAAERAKASGFRQLELGVFADNERALHLYNKLGFVVCGRLPNAYMLKDGSTHDEILMVKSL